MLKDVFLYSVYCNKLNKIPQNTVKTKPSIVGLIRFDTSNLWDQVKLTPEDNKITVFKIGKCHILINSIPIGGQILPIQIEGASEQWKNPQKNEKKNITSEVIKSTIPIFNPDWTFLVWLPWKVDSITIL